MEWSFPRHPLPARALWKQQGSVCRRDCAPTPVKTRQGSKNKCLARNHKPARGRKLQEAETAAGRNSSGAAELARPVAGSALPVFNVLDRGRIRGLAIGRRQIRASPQKCGGAALPHRGGDHRRAVQKGIFVYHNEEGHARTRASRESPNRAAPILERLLRPNGAA